MNDVLHYVAHCNVMDSILRCHISKHPASLARLVLFFMGLPVNQVDSNSTVSLLLQGTYIHKAVEGIYVQSSSTCNGYSMWSMAGGPFVLFNWGGYWVVAETDLISACSDDAIGVLRASSNFPRSSSPTDSSIIWQENLMNTYSSFCPCQDSPCFQPTQVSALLLIDSPCVYTCNTASKPGMLPITYGYVMTTASSCVGDNWMLHIYGDDPSTTNVYIVPDTYVIPIPVGLLCTNEWCNNPFLTVNTNISAFSPSGLPCVYACAANDVSLLTTPTQTPGPVSGSLLWTTPPTQTTLGNVTHAPYYPSMATNLWALFVLMYLVPMGCIICCFVKLQCSSYCRCRDRHNIHGVPSRPTNTEVYYRTRSTTTDPIQVARQHQTVQTSHNNNSRSSTIESSSNQRIPTRAATTVAMIHLPKPSSSNSLAPVHLPRSSDQPPSYTTTNSQQTSTLSRTGNTHWVSETIISGENGRRVDNGEIAEAPPPPYPVYLLPPPETDSGNSTNGSIILTAGGDGELSNPPAYDELFTNYM